MLSSGLKFIMVPWGASDVGDDVWLLENALAFSLETIFEQSLPDRPIQFADLYEQLGSDQKRSAIVPPYTEQELRTLAIKTPPGTDGIVDGLITVTRDEKSAKIASVEIAPRVFRISTNSFVVPDAFVFGAFSADRSSPSALEVNSIESWCSLVIQLAEAILEPFGWNVPASVGPETLLTTSSWAAFCALLKGKRGAKTVEEKLGYYRQAARLDPDYFWARFNAGQLYKGQEDYHSARREFLGSVKGADGNPALLGDVYFELGLCSIFLGDTKTARNFWDEALSYAPTNPTILINIAGTYEQEEDWVMAMELHQQALNIDPSNYKALINLARLKAQLGQIEAAIPLYEQALALRPNDPLRYAILGGCYLSTGDEEKAREYFERSSRLDPPGSRTQVRIDETDAPPAPGEYARQELAKLDEAAAKRQRQESKEKKGWKWFGR